MNLKLRSLKWALLALCLLAATALVACGRAAPESETIPETAEPTLAAPTAMESDLPVSDFVSRYETIAAEWDSFHSDFDQWSAGLDTCHPNAMRLALNDFAVSFNAVTTEARSLTRSSASGELADLIIKAAEEEEAAFRQLRDRWQPNNVDLFENVEQSRAKSSQAQKSAEDKAIEIREGLEDKADPETIEEFLTAFNPIDDQWNQLHDDYETLREDDDQTAAAVRKELEKHADALESIIESLEELPELKGADAAVAKLVTAAKAEMKAATAAAKAPKTTKTTTAKTSKTPTPTPKKPTPTPKPETVNLTALTKAVAASAKTIKQSGRTIDDIADPNTERRLAELQAFDTEYRRLARAWAAFDRRYNSWRQNDGGCDRTAVTADLEQYGIRISQLARDVRALPSSGYLLPIYTLLAEAADRDENAVRALRYTWQPFALDSFKGVHQERINSDNLRRGAEIAVQELQRRSQAGQQQGGINMALPPNRIDYLPIIDRPVIKWPNDARVALWISPNVEHYEYLPVNEGVRDPWPRTPYPDVQQYTYRDYGNRVGFWRMLEPLDKHGIRCCVSLNLAVLEHFPEIAEAMIERDYDFMSHGIYNTRYLYTCTQDEEREFYRDCIDTLQRHTGKQLKGMLGPAISGSVHTPDLMAEAGLIYHTDWFHDDQPTPIKVNAGKLVSVPYSIELNDSSVLRDNHYSAEYFADICKAQFDQLYAEGAESGRVMCIALHPFLIGQPHRIKYLEDTLDYIMAHDGVWQTTADEIAEYYIANYYDQAVAHAQRLSV